MSTSSGAQSGGYRSGQMGRRSGRSESRRSSTPVMPDGGSTQGVEAKPLQTTAKGIQSTSDADDKPEADVGNSSIRGKNGAGILTASVLKDQLPYGYPSDAYSSGSFPRPVAIPAPEYADAANVTHYHGPHSWEPSLPMMPGVLQAPAMQPIQGANLHSTPQLIQHGPSQLMVSSMMYGIVPPVGSSAIPAFHADGAARSVGKRHAPATASRSTVRPHGGPSFGMNGNSKSTTDSRLGLSNAGARPQAGTSMPPAGSEDRFERDADNGGDSQGSEESDKAKAGASVVENRISRKLPPGQDRYRESGAIVSTGSDGAQMTRPGKQRHAVLNSRGYPLRPGTQDCDYYLKNGSCAFGATCKFNHPELQWRLPQYHLMQCPMPYQGPTVAAAPYAPSAVPQMVPGLMPGGTIQYFMPLPSHMAPTAPGAEPNMPGSFVVPVQMMPPPPAATSPVATIRQRPDRMVGRAKLQQGMAAMQIAPQMVAAEQASGRTGGSGDTDRPAAPSPAAAPAAPAAGSAAGLRHADAPKRSSYNHRRKTTHGSADGLLEGAPLKAPVDTRTAGAGSASWVRDSATSGVDGAPPRGRVRPSSAPVSKRGGGSGNAGDRAAAAAAAAAEGAADGDSGGKRGSR